MNKLSSITTTLILILVSTSAAATNGYFSHGYGTKNKALVGTGVAFAQDALTSATNPAGTAFVGNRLDLGMALFSPKPRGYTAGNPGIAAQFPLIPQSVESDSNYFLIPSFGYSKPLNDHASWGVAMYGNGGMNSNYAPNNFVFSQPGFPNQAGVNLEQLFINGSYARKISDKSAWGVSLILANQRFDAVGLAGFSPFSSDANALTNKGNAQSTGYGLKLGWMGDVAEGLTLGVSYQTEMQMSEFDEYKGLYAEQGGFNIPSTWSVGLAWQANRWSKVTVEVQNIAYGDIPSIANPLIPNLVPGSLGTDQGPGFGWEDMTVVKVGYQWQFSPEWVWRVGYSKGDQPIPDTEVLFNVLAPGVVEQHLTFGFTRQLSKGLELNFALMYAPEETVSGVNPLGDGQTINLEMTETELEFGLSWLF